MTDMENAPAATNQKQPSFWLEFGPVMIFVLVYNVLKRQDNEQAIFIAAGIFMVAALAALIFSKVKYGRVSGMLVLTTVIISISVGLAFFSGNPVFIYMKPTVVNVLFGLGILGGVFFKKNVMKMMMGSAFTLPDKAWTTLAYRWALFFFALAGLNEYIWRSFSEDFWVNFKLFGFFPITIIFTFTQIPFILKHGKMKGQED